MGAVAPLIGVAMLGSVRHHRGGVVLRRHAGRAARISRGCHDHATLLVPPPIMTEPEPIHSQTPDGTYLFERTLADGRRVVSVVLPEDVDEIAGPLQDDPPGPEEKKRRFQVAKLLAEVDLQQQEQG